ncbi:MAG: hypothetical protein QOJ09_2134, partial [Actinomycetota bacterium]|nr:hypothetical protein [Actinomycetota bacterium]
SAPGVQSPAEPNPRDFYDSLRADGPAAPEPPRVPVQAAVGPGYFVADPVIAPVAPAGAGEDEAADEDVVDPEPEQEQELAEQGAAVESPEVVPPAAQPAAVANGADDVPPGSDRDDALVVLLRELSSAPKRRQEALLKAARSYGVLTLRAHADLVEQLPPELRSKLLPRQVI